MFSFSTSICVITEQNNPGKCGTTLENDQKMCPCLLCSWWVLCQCFAVIHGLQGLEGTLRPAQLLLQGGQGQPCLQVQRSHVHHLSVAFCCHLHVAQRLQTLCEGEVMKVYVRKRFFFIFTCPNQTEGSFQILSCTFAAVSHSWEFLGMHTSGD